MSIRERIKLFGVLIVELSLSTLIVIITLYSICQIKDVKEFLQPTVDFLNVYKIVKEKPFIEFENNEYKEYTVDGVIYNSEEYLKKYIDSNVLNYLKNRGLKIFILDDELEMQEGNLPYTAISKNLYDKASSYNYASANKVEESIKKTIREDNNSYIAGVFFYPEKSIISYNNTTYLLHEIGHSIDYMEQLKLGTTLSGTEIFEKIYQEEKKFFKVGDYFTSTKEEYFAEFFHYFVTHRNDNLKDMMPLTYAYMSVVYEHIKTNGKVNREILKDLKSIEI